MTRGKSAKAEAGDRNLSYSWTFSLKLVIKPIEINRSTFENEFIQTRLLDDAFEREYLSSVNKVAVDGCYIEENPRNQEECYISSCHLIVNPYLRT